MGRLTLRGLTHAAVAHTLLLGAVLLAGSPSAHATHDTPPVRTFSYDVQQRGTVSTDLEAFANHVATTLEDVRGWSLGGSVGYARVASGSDVTLWLAEASTMTAFSSSCSASYSCRVGRNVIINENRWRTPPPSWTRSLHDYQHYVVNHELGHWHERGHVGCAGRGQPAPVMQQQSISLQGCVANIWPLPWEREAVAHRHGVEVRPDRFSDIAGSVHAAAVRLLADAGVAGGFPDGSFRPETTVARGQMATFIARAFEHQATGEKSFPDIGDSVHADNIRIVADAGIAGGFADGTFGPHAPVLRGQMAGFLARALALDTVDTSCTPADSADSVHAAAICAVLRAGVAEGLTDGRFDPAGVVGRGQMASFLARARG